jgi:preprotein translocase SecE subunit
MGGMKVAESEEDFERAAPRPEPVAAKAGSGAKFRAIAVAASLVGAFCVGASVYFLGTPAMTGRIPVNVWMGVGAAVAAGLAWVVLKKLSPRLGYVKPGQGRAARVCAYAGFAVIALFGAVALHKWPGIGSKWFAGIRGLWTGELLGATFTLRPVLFPAVAFFVAAMAGFHLVISRPKTADFLIETQGEMKRVSWPTRREWVGSTIVVLTLVAILSFFLYGVDSLLSPLMQNLRIGF